MATEASNFNSDEVRGYISRGWLDSLEKLKGTSIDDKDKPTLYKDISSETKPKNTKWVLDKTSTMANQKDLLEEIRRQLHNIKKD